LSSNGARRLKPLPPTHRLRSAYMGPEAAARKEGGGMYTIYKVGNPDENLYNSMSLLPSVKMSSPL